MQITYFPHLHMDREAEVVLRPLGLTVWNYGLKSAQYLTDQTQREVVNKLMHANVWYRRPITDMGIVSIGACDLRPFTAAEQQLCQEARLLLFLGAVSYGNVRERGPNSGHLMVTAENFTLVEQNFELDGEYTSVRDGYIIERWIGGYRVGEVQFPTPDYTPTPIMFRQDTKLISSLLRLRQTQKRLYRRILRATELLMQAYYNDTKLSANARTLTLAAAYETLFELPESGQRKALKDVFERLFVLPDDPKVTFVSHLGRGGRPVRTNSSVKVYWANEFYQLRNSIIHGSVVGPGDYVFRGKQRHFDIATLFFVLGVKKLLGAAPGCKPTYDYIRWDKSGSQDDADDMAYEGFIYDKGDLREMIHEATLRHL